MASIRFDTSGLSYPDFEITGVLTSILDGTAGPAVSLDPGSYFFWQGGPGFSFEVTSAGLVDYDTANDGFLNGRGTDTLTVVGYPVTMDLTGLSHDLRPNITGGPNALTRDTPHELRWVPGAYTFILAWGLADFGLTLAADGQLSLSDPALSRCTEINGHTVTVTGYPVTFDLSVLSHDLRADLLGNSDDVLSRAAPRQLNLIPGSYVYILARGMADFGLTLATDGKLSLSDPALAGCAEINGNTLTFTGYTITFDLTALSHDLTPEMLGNPAAHLSRVAPQELTMLPGSYMYVLARGMADFGVTVSRGGELSLVDPALAGCALIAGHTLTFTGYTITFDLKELPHDLMPEMLGNPGVVLHRNAIQQLTIVPASYELNSPDPALTQFAFTVTTRGTIVYDTGLDWLLSGQGTHWLTVNDSPNVAVGGLIGTRWREWGAAAGPFGAPAGPEAPVEGATAVRQRFDGGEILWAPDQDMVVSVVRLRNAACFMWSFPSFAQKYFRCNVLFNGISQGLDVDETVQPAFPSSDMHLWMRMQGFGDYGFTVASFDDNDHTVHGWTEPVHLAFAAPPAGEPPAQSFPVDGLFGERWQELGGADGALGPPTTAEFADPHVATTRVQNFDRGAILRDPTLGDGLLVSAHQAHQSVELNWGGADTPFDRFRVDISRDGTPFRTITMAQTGDQGVGVDVEVTRLDWARTGRGSGTLRFGLETVPGDATYTIQVWPGLGPLGTPGLFSPFSATTPLSIAYKQPVLDAPLDPLPADGSPEAAYRSHAARANAIAKYFVQTQRRAFPVGMANENIGVELLAHFHVLSNDPEFQVSGEPLHRAVVHSLLRTTIRGHGQMGTGYDKKSALGDIGGWPILDHTLNFESRLGDYDMAVKGLVVLVRRYVDMLTAEQIDFVLRDLLPPTLAGPINPGIESYSLKSETGFIFPPPAPPVRFNAMTIPETENHLLMINSSKYIVNDILFAKNHEPQLDNTTNGVRDWLLDHLQTLVRYDFMEFNARPYQRLALHALLNLHEFGDEKISTAARLVLDYIMTKFAVSSSRGRRIAPFRRLKEHVNNTTDNNDLMGLNTDQVAKLFLTYTGPIDANGRPAPVFVDNWTFNGVLAGLAPYRPPAAAYLIAMTAHPPTQHRFYHGNRPKMTDSPDQAEGGVEVYFRSTSFLLTAGGVWLNSGYGHDDLTGYPQVAIAQSTTLIPSAADATFSDLIRFDPYPDERDAVNIGVHLGFACGANLRVPDRWPQLVGATPDGSWLLLNLDDNTRAERRLGFYVAIYRTSISEPDRDRLKATYDTVPDNFGILYAVEAATMDFATFADRIKTRNTSLPTAFEWGEIYTFFTSDDSMQTIEFWMRPDQHKYMPRVFKVNGQIVFPVDDQPSVGAFLSLPLAEGPYLKSREHQGYIEIRRPDRDPGTPPLVLDFRDPRNPLRTGDSENWP
ncbi:LGFP repeat-containing protein [Nocardia sp. BMG111209]|uniref:LGFP repeat-containing protein n=1 Tax=Nocardia sp. BMG111209 TaxID=1160137 RepID=UPI0003A75637|nr:hypothetical protein [Nocardia sp. BMG111209]